MTSEDALLEKFKILPVERQQEVIDFAEFLEHKEARSEKKPRRSLKGALAHLKLNLSDEDLRKLRDEMWRGYTSETQDIN